MDLQQMKAVADRLTKARLYLLERQPFFGRLLLRLGFGFTECGTAYTDMRRVVFDPAFVSRIRDEELQFVLLHELMHCVLKHCTRGSGKLRLMYNVACDIVVNSIILEAMGYDEMLIDGVPAMHLAPDGKEGRLYTAEAVYRMLLDKTEDALKRLLDESFSDVHDGWEQLMADELLEEVWNHHILTEGKAAGYGSGIPEGIARVVQEVYRTPKINWRQLLRDLIQCDRHDYVFTAPDRRFSGDILLPSFRENAAGARVENVWFLVDTSGSVSDRALSVAFAEVKDAVEQLESVSGELSFFDTCVTEPIAFESVADVVAAKPVGGGGTSFKAIFQFMQQHYRDEPPRAVVILTDGYAEFPEEDAARGAQVIWLIVDSEITPPWGECVRIYS